MQLQGNGLTVALASLLGALFYGVGVKVVERWLTRQDRVDSDASELRRVAIAEAQALRKELRECRESSFELQEKFLALRQEYLQSQVECNELKDQLTLVKTHMQNTKTELKIMRAFIQKMHYSLPPLPPNVLEVLEKEEDGNDAD